MAFKSNVFLTMADKFGVELSDTTPYHPQSNMVERLHRTLGRMLKAVAAEAEQNWEIVLPQCLFALRSHKSKVTGLAPYHLLFGRDAATPLENIFGNPNHMVSDGTTPKQYLAALRRRLDAAQRYARTHLAAEVSRQRRIYNTLRWQLAAHDRVWLWTPPRSASRKLAVFWTGPWIVSVAPAGGTMVRIVPDPQWATDASPASVLVSIDRLKPYESSWVVPPEPAQDVAMLGDEFAEGPVHTDDWVAHAKVKVSSPPPAENRTGARFERRYADELQQKKEHQPAPKQAAKRLPVTARPQRPQRQPRIAEDQSGASQPKQRRTPQFMEWDSDDDEDRDADSIHTQSEAGGSSDSDDDSSDDMSDPPPPSGGPALSQGSSSGQDSDEVPGSSPKPGKEEHAGAQNTADPDGSASPGAPPSMVDMDDLQQAEQDMSESAGLEEQQEELGEDSDGPTGTLFAEALFAGPTLSEEEQEAGNPSLDLSAMSWASASERIPAEPMPPPDRPRRQVQTPRRFQDMTSWHGSTSSSDGQAQDVNDPDFVPSQESGALPPRRDTFALRQMAPRLVQPQGLLPRTPPPPRPAIYRPRTPLSSPRGILRPTRPALGRAAEENLGPRQAALARELLQVPGSPDDASSRPAASGAEAYAAGIEAVDVTAAHPPRGNMLPRSP
jgi:hypothetical protein